jgi:nicotinate-nucleotide pyrophosphorylase (carboxylating)
MVSGDWGSWITWAGLERARLRLPEDLRHPAVLAIIQLSLAEDLMVDANLVYGVAGTVSGAAQLAQHPASMDITSAATISPDGNLRGRITSKATGVIAGLPVAEAVLTLIDPDIHLQALVAEGDPVKPGDVLADVSGPGQALLAGERTALNFLGRLSGIATLTHRYVEAVAATKAVILDTRKTSPGSRYLDKYAVRMGGGQNHRSGLFDMVLIKDNHIDGAGGIQAAVRQVRERYGTRFQVEVEVKDLVELEIALQLSVDRIMLDNMELETMRQAVKLTNRRVPLEASGNVSLATVGAIAMTGVDYISAGALTHSAPVLDVSMRLVKD